MQGNEFRQYNNRGIYGGIKRQKLFYKDKTLYSDFEEPYWHSDSVYHYQRKSRVNRLIFVLKDVIIYMLDDRLDV